MNDGILVPLADRIRWTSAARAGVLALPLLLWWLRPELRSTGLLPLVVGAVLVALVSVTVTPLLRVGRRPALVTVGATLLLDGVYLAGAFLALGAFGGPMGYVLLLHAIAVTLLTSFRTGLKVVLWHSIAVIVAIEAQLTGLLAGPLTGSAFPTVDLATFLGVLWAATLGTATFAAANERELRRRRYDTDVLRRLALSLEQATDVRHIATTLAEAAHRELDARRAAVVVRTQAVVAGQATTSAPVVALCPAVELPDPTQQTPFGVTLDAAFSARRPLLVPSLDPAADSWLSSILPDARNLVVLPFALDDQVAGALVLEHGRVGRLAGWLRREARIERRRLATAEQATAHAAQAFGRAALVARLRSSADTDGLTGIANRRAFDRALTNELARTARHGLPTAVLLLDVDHFKQVNDQRGHQGGDDVLRVVARILDDAVRTADLAARYGGEEFAVVLSGTGSEGARVLAERLRARIAAHPQAQVTVSIGVGATADGLTDSAALLHRADQALYLAKGSGRNRVVCAEQAALAGFGLEGP